MIHEFTGDVASNYAKYRRGYRADLFDLLANHFPLGRVLDLGCGTGQLTAPLATRAGAAIGMDPSPDMLAEARAAEVPNVVWVVGADSDVPALEPLLGADSLDLVTIGQALHWMDPGPLFATLTRLLRPGGGVAVIANGTPSGRSAARGRRPSGRPPPVGWVRWSSPRAAAATRSARTTGRCSSGPGSPACGSIVLITPTG